MSRRALLVGINQFAGGIRSLKGCVNDTLEMQSILMAHFGFQEAEIKLLHNQDATSQKIREGLGWLLSDYEGGGKDIRIFHFSSHGTQVADDSGDEWECRDEVIVPHDHDWGHPFRDDHLRAIFDPIPADVNLTFLADCCHSGTIQKGLLDSGIEFTPRYLTPPDEELDAIKEKVAQRDAEADGWIEERLTQLVSSVPPNELASKIKQYIAQLLGSYRQNKYGMVAAERHILLAACEDRQTAADARIGGTYRGAFTWAVCKAIREANGDLTYGELISRAGTHLRGYEQVPQIECPPAQRDLKVFAPLA